MTLNITQLQLKEKIRMYLLPFKSKDFQKSLKKYIWLLTSLCLAYLIGAFIAEGYKPIWEFLGVQNEYLTRASIAVLSSVIFALLFLRKDFAQVFLFLILGLFAAIKYPQQLYAVMSFSELLAIIYFIVKYAHDVGRSLFLAELNNIGIARKRTFSLIESHIGGLPVTFFLTWIPVAVITGSIN